MKNLSLSRTAFMQRPVFIKITFRRNVVKTSFENRLIDQSAPTLAGVKPGSLFPFAAEEGEHIAEILDYWNSKLTGKGICLRQMKGSNYRCLILVYRPKMIKRILSDKKVSFFLDGIGYCGCAKPEEYIEVLRRRMNSLPSFPHEIGVFLGYPLHDVIGFINNEGKNACCCGYWKVYGDRSYAERCFQRFNMCTSVYKRLFESGKTVYQLTAPA